ncbi:Dihydrolipoyllysine-residue succinyltransferase component of 2-oxoglutarate dehydrogenase complex [Buchnera aphidicola (Takecallis arundicolens)]|uniref:dihydrolipoyllysine-residue succinyltransferase n=1 Tax=Buchnera aphidicola TaxID=9 RepID=UPI0034644015
MTEILISVPELPESINQAVVIIWHKKIGEFVKQDEVLVEIETEKVILEVPAHINGVLTSILHPKGDIVTNKQTLGYMKAIKNTTQDTYQKIQTKKTNIVEKIVDTTINNHTLQLSPSIRRMFYKKNIDNTHINQKNKLQHEGDHLHPLKLENREKRIPITVIRKRISERLLRTMHNTAMLTTFNEVNMSKIMKIRQQYRNLFELKHGVKLGLMSFFIKSAIKALQSFPEINAKIDNNEMVYYKYFDINIAISTEKGLITPIIKNVDCMSMADIEKKIQDLISRGNTGQLKLSDLLGGNFTITNGGIFGSLLSTPIINPPQIAILGIHTIQDRVISVDKKIKIAPMMYIALSYDHCIIDGKEAVGFLNIIKNTLENPERILLNI